MENPLEVARLFRSWEAIVGERVARRCSPDSLAGGILKVRTSSAAWATELRYLAPAVIQKLNRELKADLVKELKVALLREAEATWAGRDSVGAPGAGVASEPRAGVEGHQGRRGTRAAPRERGLSEAEALCSEIADERLAGAARRAIAAARTGRES
jgi:hypothetical protein